MTTTYYRPEGFHVRYRVDHAGIEYTQCEHVFAGQHYFGYALGVDPETAIKDCRDHVEWVKAMPPRRFLPTELI